MIERIVIKQDKCELFHLFDHNAKLHRNLTREEIDELATQSEIREALKRAEFREYPLPQYCIEGDMYYWDDPNDLWTAEEIGDDLAKIGWRADHVPLLLELARSAARLKQYARDL